MREKYFGDRKFYGMVLAIAVPIMIQNGITNFVSLLDNLMVGRLATQSMSGVAIANQLLFVFNLAIFGAVSGVGIFGAQFYGHGDVDGMRATVRYKLIAGVVLSAVGVAVFVFGGDFLISCYLRGEGSAEDIALTLQEGKRYLMCMMVGLLPYTIAQVYASTLRETGETVLPMLAGLVAVVTNLGLNYVLIFGHLGAPRLGVAGAAIATVISRFVEAAVVMVWAHRKHEKYPFMRDVYRSMRISAPLAKAISVKAAPLLINEMLWAGGMAMLSQCYSIRGLDVVAAVNINSTLYNVFSISFLALGSAIGIIIGQMLGAGRMDEVIDADRKLTVFSILTAIVFAAAMCAVSGVFPLLYNTTASVRRIAARLIICTGICMPLGALANATYFTLRSGGKTFITFLFDSCFVWVVQVPLALILSRLTSMPVVPLFLCCQASEGIKCILGVWMVRRGVWMNNIVEKL